MLDIIRDDHRNIETLITVLKDKLTKIRAGEGVNFSLVRDIVEYLRTVSDKHHHPTEDVIYGYYLSKHPELAESSNRLEQEHVEVIQSTLDISESVDMILMDQVIPLDQFADKLEAYILLQESHMAFEESEILPSLEADLTFEDWCNIADELPYPAIANALKKQQPITISDPLFGKNVHEEYKDLCERIQWAAEA